jgi:hypothetical protein
MLGMRILARNLDLIAPNVVLIGGLLASYWCLNRSDGLLDVTCLFIPVVGGFLWIVFLLVAVARSYHRDLPFKRLLVIVVPVAIVACYLSVSFLTY